MAEDRPGERGHLLQVGLVLADDPAEQLLVGDGVVAAAVVVVVEEVDAVTRHGEERTQIVELVRRRGGAAEPHSRVLRAQGVGDQVEAPAVLGGRDLRLARHAAAVGLVPHDESPHRVARGGEVLVERDRVVPVDLGALAGVHRQDDDRLGAQVADGGDPGVAGDLGVAEEAAADDRAVVVAGHLVVQLDAHPAGAEPADELSVPGVVGDVRLVAVPRDADAVVGGGQRTDRPGEVDRDGRRRGGPLLGVGRGGRDGDGQTACEDGAQQAAG